MAQPERLDMQGQTKKTASNGHGSSAVPARPVSRPAAASRVSDNEPSCSSSDDLDPALSDFLEEQTRRMERGERVDVEALAARYPEWSSAIRDLLPALLGVAEAGQIIADRELDPEPGTLDGEGRRAFGDFRIVRQIGRGGMGVVYEAQQLPFARRVALKVLSPAAALDHRALQRFELEAQVASLMQHPRIVPLYAVGTIGDVPYYAMRYIEGGSLADLIAELRGLVEPGGVGTPASQRRLPNAKAVSEPFPPLACEGGASDVGRTLDEKPSGSSSLARGLLTGRFAPPRHESDSDLRHIASSPAIDDSAPVVASLSVANRLYIRTVARLGVQAAEALGYAHDQGIVHRDVKPANLLLDQRGDLWVADFGMADVQGGAGLTLTGDLPGTLRYMSPEQALGKRSLVDRRTDIYALGATLYELLALRPAVPGSDKQDILRRITEEEPAPLKRLNPSVSRDLATIVTKSLSKDPSNRYETAWQLGDDLASFLDGRPIAARPVGPLVRTWRWAGRKPAQAALVLAIFLGVAGITWNWREAIRQRNLLQIAERQLVQERDQKEAERAKAGAINSFLIDKLLGQAELATNPDAKHVTLLETLDRAAAEVGQSFAGQSGTEAAIRMAVGKAYHGLGEYRKSEAHYRAAYDLLPRGAGGPTAEHIEVLSELGHQLTHLEKLDEAEPLLHDAVDQARAVLGDDHEVSLSAVDYLATFYEHKGRYAEAEALYRRNLVGWQRALGLTHRGTLATMNNLGFVLGRKRDYVEAERLFRQCAEMHREIHGARHPETLSALSNLAGALEALGRLDEAESTPRQCLDGLRRTYGPESKAALYTATQLGTVLGKMGRTAEAEALLRTSLDARRRTLGPKHPITLKTAERLDALLKVRHSPN